VVNENVSLIVSRQVLSELCNRLDVLNDEVGKEICVHILQSVQPRVISYEEQVSLTDDQLYQLVVSRRFTRGFQPLKVGQIRQHLANIYRREENWTEAAKVLVGIPLETGQRLAKQL